MSSSDPMAFSLNDYQAQAKATVMYPEPIPGVPVYPLIGFAGEVGELLEALERKEASLDAVHKEAGDVLWYLAAIATDTGLKLGDLYSDFANVRFTVRALRDHFLWSPQTALSIFVGRVAEDVKKSIRDNGSVVDEQRKLRIRTCLGDTILALDALLEDNLTSLGVAAQVNMAKIAARKAAGTIQGSGDSR
jgi:hypothetical protein